MKNFIISSLIFFGICTIYFFIMTSETDGQFIYLLDDAYIHLALAKNFALHDVWGMTKHAFSSSSSSPLFTCILSFLIRLFGNSEFIPISVNILIMVLVIYFLTKYYRLYLRTPKFVIISVLITLFASAIHLQMFSGMEHVLQVLLIVLNIYFFTKWVSSDYQNRYSLLFFYGTILLLGLVRFEMMFYFVSLAFSLVFLKKIRELILVLICGFVPIFIFCYFNYQYTGFLFPNSVIVKGTSIDFKGNVFRQIYDILSTAVLNRSFYKRCLLPLLLLCFFIVKDYGNRRSLKNFYKNNFFLMVWVVTMLLHSVFADLKSILRYEAYLIVAFVMLIIPRVVNYVMSKKLKLRKYIIFYLLIFGNVILVIFKLGFAHRILMNGSKNIYEQQIQSAKFLQRYYNNSKVVANDIGAVCYFTDIHLFDIAGLGSSEMMFFNQKSNSSSDREYGKYIGDYTKKKDFEIAIVYKEWLRGHVPRDWKEVAVLSLEGNVVTSQANVTVFCLQPSIEASMKNNIKNFSWNKNIKVKIIE